MPKKGQHCSEEHKRKNSEAHMGKKNPMFGKHLSEEQKQKMSWLGKYHTEETKRKMSEAAMGKKNHNFGKKGNESPLFGKPKSIEVKVKLSESRKRFYKENPQYHPKGMLGTHHTEEAKKKIRNANFELMKKYPEKFMKFVKAGHSCVGPTKIEKLMGKILDSAQVKYIPQYPIICENHYTKFVDYLLPNHKLVIECDGEYWHQDKEEEEKRDKTILSVLGNEWRIEHIAGKEIYEFGKFLGIK